MRVLTQPAVISEGCMHADLIDIMLQVCLGHIRKGVRVVSPQNSQHRFCSIP